jgi:hypothetical protein
MNKKGCRPETHGSLHFRSGGGGCTQFMIGHRNLPLLKSGKPSSNISVITGID